MRLAVRSTVVAICLAIVALAPVAASARPAFDLTHVTLNPTSTGDVATQGQSPEVHPNPDQQVTVVHRRTVVPPIPKPVTASQLAGSELAKAHAAIDNRLTGGYSTATFSGYASSHPATVQAPRNPSANPDNGFDWGDAAIGAAAGLTLTLLVVGGAIVLSRHRSPQGDSANVATT
ncbi:MAG: hypothetical protein ACXVH3_31240 [Solirubrobacteraceae bacterium]